MNVLQILDLSYINGSIICKMSSVDHIKWQNIKRGYTRRFKPDEILRVIDTVAGCRRDIKMFLQYNSFGMCRLLLSRRWLILKPLVPEITKVQYDRILRFKRNEADLYDEELQILIKAFEQLLKTLI